ncbi:MAG: hypothetical protein JXR07_06635 [Reichenbachiella sp.]
MKKLFGIYIGIAAAIAALVSCSEENPIADVAIFEDDISSAATIDVLFEDIDDAIDYSVEQSGTAAMKTAMQGGPGRYSDCATITLDETTNTKTVDFGEEGCEGRDGRIRKGKIHFVHTGERGLPGDTKVITFEGFSVDTIGIEGVRTIINSSEAESSTKILSITLVGGKITFPDETFVTRDEEKTKTKFFDETSSLIEKTVYGTATGVNKDGLTYTHSIDESTPKLYTTACRELSKVAAVSGVQLIQVEGESDKTIDFGDGTCDNIVTVTQDGVSTEVEIDPRQRRRRHQRPAR